MGRIDRPWRDRKIRAGHRGRNPAWQPRNCAGQQGAAHAKGERQGAQRLTRSEPEPEQKSERHESSRPLAGQYGSRDADMEKLDEALGVRREQTGERQGASRQARRGRGASAGLDAG
ncbi:hypothetical protein Zm00014a_005076 [Zea mays]|uniref:Uncharacterized protein n=1 Tax=Zea mays TaxID=4577 RepID=A0A3L6DLR7_MAIZE|nr:hypothetical protein Zm00014a_005076 [Zea mays]